MKENDRQPSGARRGRKPTAAASSFWIAGGLLLLGLASGGCGIEEAVEKREQEKGAAQSIATHTEAERTETASTTDETSPEMESVAGPVPTVRAEPVGYETALSAYRERRYQEAVDLFAAYVDDHPESASGHYMSGLSAWKSGDLTAAEMELRTALELDPNHVKSRINLARVLLDDGRPEEARTEAEMAANIGHDLPDAYRVLGRTHHVLGDLDRAVEAYRQALVRDDRDVWSMNNLGLVYIQQGRFEGAVEPLARATELKDDVAVFQNNLGAALEQLGHFAAAGAAYERALQVDPSHATASASLARVGGLTEESGQTAPDLGLFADRFEAILEEWKRTTGWTGSRSPDEVQPGQANALEPKGQP